MDIKWFNVNFEAFDKTIEEVIKYVESRVKYDKKCQ